MIIHFLTFADSKFKSTLNRIKNEATISGYFDIINCFNETVLSNEIINYCQENNRGFGYWIWKPIIINQYISDMDDGDILIYCDAGCIINPLGRDRFLEYIEMIEHYDMLTFQTPHLESQYTKMDTILYLQGEKFLNTGQIAATCIMLKKTKNIQTLISKWADIAINNKMLIDDSVSIKKNCDDFIDHRHDQSIFSILCKQNNINMIGNEIWMSLDSLGLTFDNKYPFHGARLKF